MRGVRQWYELLSKHDRLLRPEKTHREQTIELNDEQIRLLERFSPEFRERQIEVHYTGELVAVDTFFVGAHTGAGKVYLQTVLDEHFRIKGRGSWYESVKQMQTDLDSYLEHYKTPSSHIRAGLWRVRPPTACSRRV